MSLETQLAEVVATILTTNYSLATSAEDISFSPTKKEFKGTFTFMTFPFAGRLKQNPESLGNAIGEAVVKQLDTIAGFNVVKGFLNFELEESYWRGLLYDLDAIELGKTSLGNREKVMVEYSSPNTNKPLHLGHLRNNFLGFALAEILKANDFDVVKANLINDRGIHICKSMVAYQVFGNGETPESRGVKGDHLVGEYYVKFDKEYKKEIEQLIAQGKSEEEAKKEAPILLKAQTLLLKWEQNDSETRALWEQMNQWVYAGFDATYDLIGVDFDKFYYESNTYLLGKDIVQSGLEKGVFEEEKDKSIWIDLTNDKLDRKLVQRGDGTSVYITQDMGTADLKYTDFGVSKSIYVVGNEQDYHFIVLKKILQKLERPYADGIYHLSYGMVDLPSGKMKSREGTVVDADDLVNEMIATAKARTIESGKIDGFSEEEASELYRMLALGALKYFILKVDPKKRMLFNPEESIEFQGNTGPFIQYTHARIAALVRKATEEQLDYKIPVVDYVPTSLEAELVNLLAQFNKKVAEAGENYSPALIANYCYELAKTYNSFYAEHPIFKATEEEQRFRIALSLKVAEVIKKGMGLLGIEVPERM